MTGSSVVVDASFMLEVVLPGPASGLHQAVIDRLENEGVGLFAPALWLYETTSALCKAVRFEQISPTEGSLLLGKLDHFGVEMIEPDAEQCRLAMSWTYRLRRSAAYDSFYLSLAETFDCDLWTADRRLRNAVNLPWVRFVGDNG